MLLPITIVTAIVSPSARPSPRITAPRIPESAVRDEDLRNRFPFCRAERESRFPLGARDGQKHVAGDGRNE